MLHLPRRHSQDQPPGRPVPANLARLTGIGCLWMLAAMGSSAQESDSARVTAVRFWSLGDVTRIAVETDGSYTMRSDRLRNPDRLFFDFVGAKPRIGSKGVEVIPVADKRLRQIRVAETQQGITRVVLDMESAPIEFTTSRLENPDRLIIELRAPGAEPPAPKSLKEGTEAASVPAPPSPVTVERPIFKPPVRQPPPNDSEAARKRAQSASMEPPPMVDLGPPRAAPPSVADPAVSRAVPPAARIAPPPSAPIVPVVPASSPASATPAADGGTPAKRMASGDRSMIRVLGLKVGRIVLDPGHGGHDTGTIAPGGLREKDLVLDVTKHLGAMIEDRMGWEVIYTRSDDTFIPLERRTAIANEAKADLFLSIHANSSTLPSAAGVETYYLNFTTSKTALDLAARENAGSEMTIFDLQDLLQKIALKDKVEESREFASRIQDSLYTLSAHVNASSKNRGVRKAPFVVLIGAQMPSVLAEIGFISNSRDESLMGRSDHREKIAEALYKGLSSYAGTLSHFQVAQRRP
jgi:N-acetylmuramoyl-L-alanine amidase